MLLYTDLEVRIMQLIEAATLKNSVGTLQGNKIVLGSLSGPAGGSGLPIVPFVGQLSQKFVALDTDEFAITTIPTSGSSLLDNLNRIRAGEVIIPDYSPSSYTVTISGNLNAHLEGVDDALETIDITISGINASGMDNIATTKGDLLARSVTALDRLGIGASGYVLTVDPAETLGMKWSEATGGGAWGEITGTISDQVDLQAELDGKVRDVVTTKGDLFVRNSTVVDRLGIGIDDYVLTADATETTGMKWAAASGISAIGANPSAEVGLVAVNGIASTFLRSDGAPALDQGIAPTWTAEHTFNNNIDLITTTTSSTGVIEKGGDRFIHDFHHPVGGSAVPEGKNIFVGVNAGNFTMGSTATLEEHGSNNIGIGYEVLLGNTTGDRNVAIGNETLYSNTTGTTNVAVGYQAMYSNTEGASNFAIGYKSLYINTTGSSNIAVGTSTLNENTTGSYNVAVGYQALKENTTGEFNVAVGFRAGRWQIDGSDLATPENSIYIGVDAKGKDNDDDNSIVIGYMAQSLGANTTVIGSHLTTDTKLFGALTAELSITTASGATIDEFSIDGTLAGDSDTAVPTEKAVKKYVDDNAGGTSGPVFLTKDEPTEDFVITAGYTAFWPNLDLSSATITVSGTLLV